jgi:hypothetical protein
MRSTPQLPLETPEVDPEKIIRKGKALHQGTSTTKPSISDDFHYPIGTPIFYFHTFCWSFRTLNFGSVPIEFSPPGLGLEGETLVTPLSPEVVPWFRPSASEDFPTLGFTAPPPITVSTTTEREISVPSSPLAFSPNPLLFPFPPGGSIPASPILTPSPPNSPPPHIPMAGDNPPRNRMDAIVVARYVPLVLPHPMNSLPTRDYLKYIPKFTGEEDIIVEENLASFYSYADNLNIENEDVWMRVFVQSLDGEARKWFRDLTPISIAGIEALDYVFLRWWGDKKDFMYYVTEFGSLKRKEGELVSDFSKQFNKMYNKIPAKIKPTEASTKITYASAFDPDFCLLLRERRSTSLDHMQDAALEVESNVLAVDRLRNKSGKDRGRERYEASTSGSPACQPQVDELTKMVKSISIEMEKMKFEGKQGYKNVPNIDNRSNFRRPNNIAPQIMPRDPRNGDRYDQKIQTPLQNNLVANEEGEEEELDPEIHCIGDTSPFPHLTQSVYEESLMNSQINELRKGGKANNSPNKYNLGSKKKEGKYDIPNQPSIA